MGMRKRQGESLTYLFGGSYGATLRVRVGIFLVDGSVHVVRTSQCESRLYLVGALISYHGCMTIISL